jgi:hypothetical protein
MLALLACDDADDRADAAPTREALTREELLDPATCKECHGKHYEEWSASMHAYAAEDPVFIAMNRRGQEETDGGLGDFCVNCHAPMAVREGAFANGDFTDFEQVPDHLEGVTCYFCHNVVDVERDHNNGLVLADDTTMRANVRNAVEPWAHGVEATAHFDPRKPESSQLCGSCHDIVLDNGLHLERTYEEYQNTIFATSPDEITRQSCNDCHMDATPGEETIADYTDSPVPARTRHIHLWPAVDVALTDFPHRPAMESAVARYALPNSIVNFVFEALPMSQFQFRVSLETGAGHRQPSGASLDRRMWLEWVAFGWDDDEPIARSGTIGDREVETGHDSDPWMMRDTLFADEAKTVETHMFWEAVALTARTIPEPMSNVPGQHTLPSPLYTVPLPGGGPPKRIEFRVRMRPMGLDVLNDLVDSGHLDSAIRDEMKTFTVRADTAEWSDPNDPHSYRLTPQDDFIDDREYLCLLHPDGGYCD